MVFALTIIIYAWFFTFLFVLASVPHLMLRSRSWLIDAGWALARPLSWFCLSLIIWLPAHFGLGLNRTFIIYSILIGSIVVAFIYLFNHHRLILNLFRSRLSLILIEELLFFIGFVGLSLIRGFNPAMLDLEKFMDGGFIASYLRSPTLPAPDIWLSGHTINYYSFGHFMGSIMTRLWNLPLAYTYNLLLGLIAGLGLSLSFSVAINLISFSRHLSPPKPSLIVAGLTGALLVCFTGNSHTLWYYLSKGSWQGYWYADATRFIHNTIHEFPSYSFVVSDLHGHLWDFPLVLSFLLLYLYWLKRLWYQPRLKVTLLSAAALGIFLGGMTMTNMWDLLIYGLLLLTTGLLVLFTHPKNRFLPLLYSALTVGITLALVTAPFFVHFQPISQGIALVSARSPLSQFLALWTSHLLMSLVALTVVLAVLYRRHRRHLQPFSLATPVLILVLIFLAWFLLLTPEVIYFKDIYSGHPRANTMFKFTYQGFILLGLIGAWALGYVYRQSYFPTWKRLLVTLFISSCFIAVAPFPLFAYRDYYAGLKTFKSLDGWQWLAHDYPDDYQAILWLNQNITGQPVILESWGESYTTFDRVSAFTGLPTVIGWRVHEWLWRGGFDIAGSRSTDVDTIFQDPTSQKAQELLSLYQVKYLFVGQKEREAYPQLQETALKSLGQVVFRSGSTFIVALP